MQEDPARDELNWYSYCENNPIRYIDPSGLITKEEKKLYKQGKLSQDVYNILLDLDKRIRKQTTTKGKNEIRSLRSSFRKNNYQYEDCTFTATVQLEFNADWIKNKKKKEGLIAAGLAWYKKVDNYGKWDYKQNYAKWMPEEGYFLYEGKLITPADFGNINYGYTGTALGLSSKTLYEGGGHANPNPTTYEKNYYYGDSELDHRWIRFGISLSTKKGRMLLAVDAIFKIKRWLE